ncbi:hypothetical protein Ahy_B07g088307 isoform B [Arachis hypogaea]|uniref:non-specific serine/threonine protein kinase n=1 Tax=Arachis hypogaea TaxID=3818 RepID=A0A444YE46_ARAHY|nr:hypothetical protein Ahy_B07g088307 isoform B [Arachis hypogaea]
MKQPRFIFSSFFFLLVVVDFVILPINAESKCSESCGLALASYYLWDNSNLTYIATVMKSEYVTRSQGEDIVSYNNGTIKSKDSVTSSTRINVPFPCECINGEFLGHVFQYSVLSSDTYDTIANWSYSNLVTAEWLQNTNTYSPNNIPYPATVNVTVNCSCGNGDVSKDYGLFITYPLRPEDSLESIANKTKIDAKLLQGYNPGVNFSKGSGLVYIPGKDENGNYVPFKLRFDNLSTFDIKTVKVRTFCCSIVSAGKGLSGGVIGGISVGIVAALLLLVFGVYVKCYRRKKIWNKKLVAKDSSENFVRQGETSHNAENTTSASDDTSIIGVKVEKSAEFSYEELANATNNFSLAKKIGQGGFGEVYYGELNGERAAIKKMDMKASKEFLAELKVLTRVHHLNLVRLIGYCVEGSLFLVYEYIENGNLSQHLRNSDSEPLPWSTRVQIALDSARGLEYIHEHTMPVYIHRDVKSENILLDRNFRGKVADFGLTKLIDVGNSSAPTANMAGTFGYMPPEYVYGSVSPKIDVYAFGVVLYELISAKEALMRSGGASGAELKGLVALFEEVFIQPDPKEGLKEMVDPRLGDNYSIESVYKMAQLAKACTEGDPQRRPKMRSVVVALMTLSSTTENWDIASFYENPALVNLMSESKCSKSCDLAFASYYLWNNDSSLLYISYIMQSNLLHKVEDIVRYNKDTSYPSHTRVNVPIPCDCINDGEFLGHTFQYSVTRGDDYLTIANGTFSNLVTAEWLQNTNSYSQDAIPAGGKVNVTVNCSCGDSNISKHYGLFITYPLRPEDSLQSIANQTKLDPELLMKYNPSVNFSKGNGLMKTATMRLFAQGLPDRIVAGISVGVVAVVLLLAFCVCIKCCGRKKKKLRTEYFGQNTTRAREDKASDSFVNTSVEKSAEFSYEELAHATNNFSLANKIGQGGFGEIYYAELNDKKAAIKKMDMKASKEFLAELKVLTHVQHLNLVHLIGYCVKDFLFLVYEYIDNGNLSEHLRNSDREPLPWSTRIQIALDSARGLEYIHEHTKPVYIHRDIKSSNILLDKSFHGKVADFGLAKLIDTGSSSAPTANMAGTFGYMPPEYVYGRVSPKLDVFAFGVVLYELISAKEAVINGGAEIKGLVALFHEVFDQPDPKEGLKELVDPRLGENYSIDSVFKMAQLANACTERDPKRRPKMRSVVVALMTLGSGTENWDIASFYENPALVNLMSESKCRKSCGLALASYYLWPGSNLTYIATVLESRFVTRPQDIANYNKNGKDYTRVNVPFPCECINGEFLGYTFQYSVSSGDTYESIAGKSFSNLVTAKWLRSLNSYSRYEIPENGMVNVTVNCSCGDSNVSKDYGLFITYPLRPEDSLESIVNQTKLDPLLLLRYNPGVNFSKGSGLVYVPGKDVNGNYEPFHLRRKKKLPVKHTRRKTTRVMEGDSVEKSAKFSYEELANATDNFSLANKIGQGGFAEIYYAELNGERAAIKKMDKTASKEFLAELKVLTRVHHLNLVRLIGYCIKGSLFLVYEYIDNGNLSQHLQDSDRKPLSWSDRIQIALDSARGLEYIHECTTPVYIHRDIKSANILIDKFFHGKVADFGLAKLIDVGSSSVPTDKMAGTFGYMPPEYIFGNVSPKVDVYAFGVVLYELISAKEAVIKDGDEIKSLVALMAQLAKACTERDPRQRPKMRSVVLALGTLNSNIENWDLLLQKYCSFESILSAR